MVPENRWYTKEHEWVEIQGEKARVGITQHAQEQLGDIVYVELPKVGSEVKQMAPSGVIESVKAVSEIYAPISGVVVEVNQQLNDHPEKINQDPYESGWMFALKPSNPKEIETLLKPKDYLDLIGVAH